MSNFLDAMRFRQQHLNTLGTTGLHDGKNTPVAKPEVKEAAQPNLRRLSADIMSFMIEAQEPEADEQPAEKKAKRQPTKGAMMNKVDSLTSVAELRDKKTGKTISRKKFLLDLEAYLGQFEPGVATHEDEE